MTMPNAEASKNLPDSGGESAKTFTEKDYQDMRNAVLGEAGKIKAEGEKALKAGQAALDRLAKWEQEQADRELEAHRDDPAEIRRIRAEQGKKKADADLAELTQKLNDSTERLARLDKEKMELTRNQLTQEIATRLNVDIKKLSNLAKFTDGTAEAIEDIAKDLPKLTPPKPGLKIDSNRSLGGNLTWEAVREAYIKDPYAPGVRERYLEMRPQNR